MDAIRVFVPGSTSNLGPGFDVLGLAVDRGLSVTWTPGPGPLALDLRGTLEGQRHAVADDLVAASLRAALAWRKGQGEAGVVVDAGGTLVMDSRIPVARGLGSSAAARVAGWMLGLAFRSARQTPEGSSEGGRVRDVVLHAACAAEGHPDNVAPALYGGLVAAGGQGADLKVAALPLSPAVGWAWVAPPIEVRTADARAALPREVPHALVGETGARLAVLLSGLALADGDRIAWGVVDRVHSPWRLPLVPGAALAIAAGREAGAWGVTLSGSGSGLVALGPRETMPGVRDAMAAAFTRAGQPPAEGAAFVFRPDPVGARAGVSDAR